MSAVLLIRIRQPQLQWKVTAALDADVSIVHLLVLQALKDRQVNGGAVRLFLGGAELKSGRKLQSYLNENTHLDGIVVNGIVVQKQQQQQQQQQQQLFQPRAQPLRPSASSILFRSSNEIGGGMVGPRTTPPLTPTPPPPSFVSTQIGPSFGLEADRLWRVENFNGGQIALKKKQVKLRQAVYIGRCINTRVEIPRRVSKITLYDCSEVTIVCAGALAAVEVIRSRRVNVVVTNSLSLVQIDMSFDVNLQLSERAILQSKFITTSSEDVHLSSWPPQAPPPPSAPASSSNASANEQVDQAHELIRALTPPPQDAASSKRRDLARSAPAKPSVIDVAATDQLHTFFLHQSVPCSLFGDQLVSWVEGRGALARLVTMQANSLKDSGGFLLVGDASRRRHHRR